MKWLSIHCLTRLLLSLTFLSPLVLSGCGGGSSGVSVDAEPNKPNHPEAEVLAVTNLQIAETRANSILLRWQYPTSATYFEIQRDGKVIATINGDLLSYQDNNLQPNQTFGYQVIALNASGQRSESVSVSATTIANEAPEIRNYPPSITLTSEAKKDQLVYQFFATDKENQSLSWRLSGDNSALFVISAQGELSLKQAAAGMGGKVYQLQLEVSDGISVSAVSVNIGFIEMALKAEQQGLLRQVYSGQTFTTEVSSLLSFDDYPDSPASTSLENQFKSPSNIGGNYGQRMAGYLLPAISGDYRFWIASDDSSELRLSSDSNADNAKTIASVSGWVGEDNWDRHTSQQSQFISLRAGEVYYIEALMVEVGGADHLSVAWQPPGDERTIIDGPFLRQPLDTQAPEAVDDLTVIQTEDAGIILEWQAPNDNKAVTGYEVWNGGLKLSEINAADLSETNIEMTNLDSGIRYDFYLVAYDAAGNRSARSNVAAIMISDYIAPTAVTNLTLTDITPFSAQLNWIQPEANLLYRIFDDETLIATTTQAQHLLSNLDPATDYLLKVVSVDAAGNTSEQAAEINLTTTEVSTDAPDFNGQQFYAAVAADSAIGRLVFKAQATAVNGSNDVISYNLTEDSSGGLFSLSSDGLLTLQRSAAGASGQQYTLTVEATQGTAVGSMQLQVMVISAERFNQQGVNQQIWTGISGNSVANIPLTAMPQSQNLLMELASKPALGNYYGQRVRGFLEVPRDGNYNFWIASDDNSQLLLSPDMDPNKAELIARVNGYTGIDAWYNGNRVKTNIELKAGQLYYIEVLHKEGGGGDHMSVAWQGPEMANKSRMSGEYLMPFSALYPSTPTVDQLVQSGFDQQGEQLTLTLNIPADAAGLPVFIYYGTVDAGDQISGWQNMQSAGTLAAGQQQVNLPGIIPGQDYFVRVEVRGAAGSSWSSVVPVTTQIIPAGKQAGEALPQTINISVDINGENKHLSFYKHSVRSPNYQLLTFDDRRQQQYQAVVPMPEPRTYRGRVTNDPYLVVTGVIDADGNMHISAWRGDGRAWGKVADFSHLIDADALGNNETTTDELQISVDVPANDNNRYFVPQPGADFHNNLARVSFKHEYNQFVNQARGNIINSIAQMENHINETDYVWAQKTGLRWDVGRALIEVHGDSTAENTQPRPTATDATNFTIEFQDPVNGGYCWGGGDWVGCVANFTHNWGFTHEIGHNMGLGHGEQTDNNNQIMAPGSQLGNMQARKTTRRLQAGSKFKPAKTITDVMPPAAFKDYLSVYQNEAGNIAVLANDYDVNGEVLSILEFQATTAKGGQVSQQGNILRYTPPTDYIGVDQFTYTVTDGTTHTVGPVQIQVMRHGITGDWTMEKIGDNNQVLDSSGDHNHLNAPELSALTSGSSLTDIREADNSNHAMTLQLMASAEKAEDALGHKLLPHKLDPGHKSFTATMRIRYNNLDGARLLMGKSSSGPNNMEYGGWEIRSNGSTVQMQVNFRDRLMITNHALISQENALTDGVWHHLAMVIDRENNELRGYVNGIALTTTATLPQGAGPITAAMNNTSYGGGSPFRVGGHAQLTCSGEGDAKTCELPQTQAFDDVKVYHKALTVGEIRALSAQ